MWRCHAMYDSLGKKINETAALAIPLESKGGFHLTFRYRNLHTDHCGEPS